MTLDSREKEQSVDELSREIEEMRKSLQEYDMSVAVMKEEAAMQAKTAKNAKKKAKKKAKAAEIVKQNVKEYHLRCNLVGHKAGAQGICICGNAGIATSSKDKTVRFWTLDKSQKHFTLSKILEGHTKSVRPLAWIPPNIDFHEGGVISGGYDALVLVWNLATGEKVQMLNLQVSTKVTGIALDGSDVVTSSLDRTLRHWTGDQLMESWVAHDSAIHAVIKLPSGELVTGSSDKTLKVWKGKSCINTFVGHSGIVTGLSFMPNLGILSASHDGLWNLSGKPLRKMVGPLSKICCVDAHASGLIVSGSENQNCSVIWKDGICVQSIEHPGFVLDAKFLENGDIVTACSDGTVRIWTIDTEKIANTVELDSFASQLSQYNTNRCTSAATSSNTPSQDQLTLAEEIPNEGQLAVDDLLQKIKELREKLYDKEHSLALLQRQMKEEDEAPKKTMDEKKGRNMAINRQKSLAQNVERKNSPPQAQSTFEELKAGAALELEGGVSELNAKSTFMLDMEVDDSKVEATLELERGVDELKAETTLKFKRETVFIDEQHPEEKTHTVTHKEKTEQNAYGEIKLKYNYDFNGIEMFRGKGTLIDTNGGFEFPISIDIGSTTSDDNFLENYSHKNYLPFKYVVRGVGHAVKSDGGVVASAGAHSVLIHVPFDYTIKEWFENNEHEPIKEHVLHGGRKMSYVPERYREWVRGIVDFVVNIHSLGKSLMDLDLSHLCIRNSVLMIWGVRFTEEYNFNSDFLKVRQVIKKLLNLDDDDDVKPLIPLPIDFTHLLSRMENHGLRILEDIVLRNHFALYTAKEKLVYLRNMDDMMNSLTLNQSPFDEVMHATPCMVGWSDKFKNYDCEISEPPPEVKCFKYLKKKYKGNGTNIEVNRSMIAFCQHLATHLWTHLKKEDSTQEITPHDLEMIIMNEFGSKLTELQCALTTRHLSHIFN